MKYLIIIPGFGENGKEKVYKTLSKNAQTNGFEVFILAPEWGKKTISQCVLEAEGKINKLNINTSKTVLLGFSFGAFIGLDLAKKYSFKKFLCCSCAPYFKENLIKIPSESVKFFGKKMMSDFKNFPISKIKNLKTKKIELFFGEKDWDIAIKTAQKIALQNNTKLQIIKNTGHELNNEYLKVLIKKI